VDREPGARTGTVDCIAAVRAQAGSERARPLLDLLEMALLRSEPLLPPIPPSVHQVCRMVDAPRCDVLALAHAIGGEPALAARLIAIANSAFFAGRESVHTVRDSIVRMGIRETRNVVVGIALREVFWNVSEFAQALIPLWQHSLATAAAAQGILCEVAFDDNSGFLTGLTHDIGRVAVLSLAAASPELGELRRAVPAPLAERVIDALHPELGAVVLQQWGFPSRIASAVRHHHDPDLAPPAEQAMAAALQAADWMAHRFGETRSWCPVGADPMASGFARFQISEARGETLMIEGRARFDELMKIL
jgi:HD-like signal output (HDOD) protein